MAYLVVTRHLLSQQYHVVIAAAVFCIAVSYHPGSEYTHKVVNLQYHSSCTVTPGNRFHVATRKQTTTVRVLLAAAEEVPQSTRRRFSEPGALLGPLFAAGAAAEQRRRLSEPSAVPVGCLGVGPAAEAGPLPRRPADAPFGLLRVHGLGQTHNTYAGQADLLDNRAGCVLVIMAGSTNCADWKARASCRLKKERASPEIAFHLSPCGHLVPRALVCPEQVVELTVSVACLGVLLSVAWRKATCPYVDI